MDELSCIKIHKNLIKIKFLLQAHKKFECTITLATIWTMWANYEKFRYGYVSVNFLYLKTFKSF